ncbi:MAG: hypothetical protein LC733_00490 [Actinobacteria bacterium]|nr:hypothetical protein [Actinomycetota bacterium]
MSPRKQSFLGELDRAPGGGRSRIALRRFLVAGQPAGRPSGASAAIRMED